MTSGLLYQFIVGLFSGAAGFVAGLGVSWKTRRDDTGNPIYTPTLNTSRGMRALFVMIAVLALGSLVATAVVNDQTKRDAEEQAACNKELVTIILKNANINRSDIVNNAEMVRRIALFISQPREERSPREPGEALDRFLTEFDRNSEARNDIPIDILGCAV